MTNQTIGSYLKDLRLRKGYSLERVSTETKISLTILKKLELNEFKSLPNITYVKGYVQNILKTLHTPFTQYEIDLIQSTYIALGLIKEEPVPKEQDTPLKKEINQEYTSAHEPKGNIYNIASLKSKRIIFSILSVLALLGLFRFVQKINKQPDLRQSQITKESPSNTIELEQTLPLILTSTPVPQVSPEVTTTPEIAITPTPEASPTMENILYPKFEFKKISNLAVSINPNSEDNGNTTLYPDEDRKKIVSGKQNVFITKTEGESWISFKKDQDAPRSTLLKAGQKFLINGDKIFLTIGNTTGVKVFYNGQAVQFVDNKGVKSFIFPLVDANQHSLPLFVRDSKDKLYFYQDYIPLMNQEPTSVSP
jgi:cytoskeletal protein RodZ